MKRRRYVTAYDGPSPGTVWVGRTPRGYVCISAPKVTLTRAQRRVVGRMLAAWKGDDYLDRGAQGVADFSCLFKRQGEIAANIRLHGHPDPRD